MNAYIQQLQKVMELSDGDADSVSIIDKDGYIEYFQEWGGPYAEYVSEVGSDVLGKNILGLYPELTEDNSTIMETLRTGRTVLREGQVLTRGRYQISMNCVTYPILEDGEIQGAIEVANYYGFTLSESKLPVKGRYYITDDIITRNRQMKELKEKIQRVAESPSTVLIYGETGTGKELVAESIHMSSKRCSRPFISQNCAAIPSSLLESLFFGTEKGSFTGAETRKGLFELADGGTLFLDEINSMELSMQAKLLKALEEKKARRVGGSKEIGFDARIICAANEDPRALVEAGRMREDLYYRIGVVKLFIPPLRERREDILLLTNHFINLYNRQMGRNIVGLSSIVEGLFEHWDWPGNVRELKNAVESAFNLARGDRIVIQDVQELFRASQWGTAPRPLNRNALTQPAGSNHVPWPEERGERPERAALADESAGACEPNAPVESGKGLEPAEPGKTAKAAEADKVPEPAEPDEAADTERETGGSSNNTPQIESMMSERLMKAMDGDGISLEAAVSEYESYLIRTALLHESQLKDAAEKLSISPQRLQYRMKKLNLKPWIKRLRDRGGSAEGADDGGYSSNN